jgi:polysaccharide pyruvyl transferase WcaK-like protein
VSDETVRPIAFFGLFGVGNIGNEASLAAAIMAARRHRPLQKVCVVAADPERVATEHGVSAVPISMAGAMPSFVRFSRPIRLLVRPVVEVARWIAAYRFLRTVDAVVVPGTGILDDFGVKPQEMPYDLVRWSAAARLARRPFSLIGVGAGPIDQPVSRRLMRRAVLNARVVTYRDEESRAFMAGLGAWSPGNAVQPDVAFALPRPAARDRDGDADWEIGLGVMTYYGWANNPSMGQQVFESYVRSMTAIASRVVSAGHRVRVLIGERTDELAAERIISSLRSVVGADADDVLIYEPADDFAELMRQIVNTDALIATRYHNVIAGLMTATPTISIGYAEKNSAVMRRFGLEGYAHHVDHIDVGAVIDDLERLLKTAGEVRPRLRATAEQLADQVNVQFDSIFDGLPIAG